VILCDVHTFGSINDKDKKPVKAKCFSLQSDALACARIADALHQMNNSHLANAMIDGIYVFLSKIPDNKSYNDITKSYDDISIVHQPSRGESLGMAP
jgi:hypothetical protein